MILDLDDVMERVQDDRELLMELLDIFVADFQEKRPQMSAYVSAQDFEQFRDVSHSLKGAAGNISAKQIFQSCFQLEKKAEEKTLDGVDDILVQLDQQFSDLVQYVTDFKSRTTS